MLHHSIVNLLVKNKVEFHVTSSGKRFWAEHNKQILSWSVNPDSDNAICVHLRKVSDEPDCQSDYFPGYYVKTLAKIKTDFLKA